MIEGCVGKAFVQLSLAAYYLLTLDLSTLVGGAPFTFLPSAKILKLEKRNLKFNKQPYVFESILAAAKNKRGTGFY